MTPSDPLTLLKRADPAARIDAGAPPPEDVLASIVASGPVARTRPRRRRALRLVPVGFALAAAVAVLGALLAGDGDVDVAEKAYAATSPAADVLYTEVITETVRTGIEPTERARGHMRSWQQGDREHKILTDLDENGRPNRIRTSRGWRPWVHESVQDGDVLRLLTPEGRVDTVREGDGAEATQILADGRRSIVERFRARYAGAELRDAGETTFAGRPARAYEVSRKPSGRPQPRETYYLDPDSGLPFGAVSVYGHFAGPSGSDGPDGQPSATMRITETVLRFERLPATPANLAKLEAPAVEAAAARK
ncbi:MAG TPA: hypothetical protein VGW75_04080 [Solirubrobacteraceae bacterium]|nr:hypothetical protein [Solirubrobacteraceae bacterium]